MPKYYNESRKLATMKYQKEKMDQIAIRIPKGKREIYKKHAERVGKPLYKLICDLIEEDIKKHGGLPEGAGIDSESFENAREDTSEAVTIPPARDDESAIEI